jgi:manganese efflux pump family protein
MIALLSLLVSIGLDTLAVAIGLGVAQVPRAYWLRLAVTFACFEAAMPILGLFAGRHLASAFGHWAGIAAAAVLIIVGAHAFYEALADDDDRQPPEVGGWRLLLLGLSVSLDEAAVGFSLGVIGAHLGIAIAFIAAQALALTVVGLWIGRRAGKRLGERAELASGAILVALGVALAIERLTGAHWLGGLAA